jgi:DnaJ-class molecular chaperone
MYAFHILALYIVSAAQAWCSVPLYVELPVTIEDAYNARTKRVTVTAWRCDCGVAAEWHDKRVLLMVPINAETVNDETFVFEGTGHDPLFRHTTPPSRGDIYVKLRLQPHPVYQIDSVVCHRDLHATVPVSVRDYYYGRAVALTSLADSGVPLSIQYDRTVRVEVLRGHGLPSHGDSEHLDLRGDLYVFFNLTLPDIPQNTLNKPHVRMFFEMLFGLLWSPHTSECGVYDEADGE